MVHCPGASTAQLGERYPFTYGQISSGTELKVHKILFPESLTRRNRQDVGRTFAVKKPDDYELPGEHDLLGLLFQ